ncbi:MAG: CDP-alcohol phosphatidyltransferase family protein [Bryobacteraceae bacterium]
MRYVPNLLSAARLALAPYLFFLLARREYRLALAVCLIAGVTDGLDGLIARRYSAASRLGAYLDPVADKILLSGAFVTLAISGAIETWLAVLVLGRDALILLFAAGAFALTSLRNFPPSIWGKTSTAAQIAFVFVVVASFAGVGMGKLIDPLKWLTVALTCVSAAHYGWRGFAMTRPKAARA